MAISAALTGPFFINLLLIIILSIHLILFIFTIIIYTISQYCWLKFIKNIFNHYCHSAIMDLVEYEVTQFGQTKKEMFAFYGVNKSAQ